MKKRPWILNEWDVLKYHNNVPSLLLFFCDLHGQIFKLQQYYTQIKRHSSSQRWSSLSLLLLLFLLYYFLMLERWFFSMKKKNHNMLPLENVQKRERVNARIIDITIILLIFIVCTENSLQSIQSKLPKLSGHSGNNMGSVMDWVFVWVRVCVFCMWHPAGGVKGQRSFSILLCKDSSFEAADTQHWAPIKRSRGLFCDSWRVADVEPVWKVEVWGWSNIVRRSRENKTRMEWNYSKLGINLNMWPWCLTALSSLSGG